MRGHFQKGFFSVQAVCRYRCYWCDYDLCVCMTEVKTIVENNVCRYYIFNHTSTNYRQKVMNNGENQFTCFSCDHSLCLKCVTETAIYKKYKIPKIPDRKEMVRPITWPTVNQVTCLVPLITSSSYLFISAYATSPSISVQQ